MTRPLMVLIGFAVITPAALSQDDDELAEICAGTRQPFVSPPFARFDVDEDERLTADEATACDSLAAIFTRLDLDANEVLTRAEYRAFADTWRRRSRAFSDDAP